MKTTIDLPDELVRTLKIRAARESRTLKDVVTDLLRRGMVADDVDHAPATVDLPLVECVHGAQPEQEMTPERVASVLADHEVQDLVS